MNHLPILYFFLISLLLSFQGKSQEMEEAYSKEKINLILPFSHTTRITSMAFSSDGRYLITGDLYGWLKIWEMATGVPVLTTKAHKKEIYHLSFSSGQYFYSASEDGTLKQWKLGTAIPVKTVGSEEVPIKLLAVASKLNLALLFYQQKYQLWGLDQLEPALPSRKEALKLLPSYGEDLRIICSADLKYIAYRDTSKLEIIDLTKKETLYTFLAGQADRFYLGAFSNDNKYFAFNVTNGFSRIEVFDINKKMVIRTLTFKELISNLLHVSSVDAISFLNKESNFLVTAGMDSKIRLWDVSTGHQITNYKPDDMAEPTDGELIWGLSELGPGGVTVIQVAPNDQYFVAATKKELSTWALRSFIQNTGVAELSQSLTCAEIHPNQKAITVAYKDGRIADISSSTGEELKMIKPSGQAVRSLKILNRQLVFIELEDGRFEVYHSEKEKRLCLIDPRGSSSGKEFTAAANHQYVVTAARLQEKASTADSTVQIWSATTGQALYAIPGFASGAHQVAISTDGRYVAFSGNKYDVNQFTPSTFIRVWSMEEKKILEDTRFDFKSDIQYLAFSEDGNRLLVFTQEGQLKILDVLKSYWISNLSLMGGGPVEYVDELEKGDVTFIRFGNRGNSLKQEPSKVKYWDNTRWQNRADPYLISLPENIAALHPITEQLLVGYSSGGLLILNLVISLNEAHKRWDGQPYPYAPFHPFYLIAEESFLALHEGPLLDAQMSDDKKVAMSVGVDSKLKKSDFFVNEANIPSLYQWSATDAVLKAVTVNNGTDLFIGKLNGDVLRCKITSASPVTLLHTHPNEVSLLCSDLQQKWLASCDVEGNIVLFDLQTKKRYLLDDGNQLYNPKFDHLSFSPGARYLLGAADNNSTIHIWNVDTKKHIRRILPSNFVSDMCFSLDDKELIIGYGNYQPEEGLKNFNLDYFDIQSGEIIKNVTGTQEYFHSFSIWNGQQIAWFIDDDQVVARLITSSTLPGIATIKRPHGVLEQIRLLGDEQHILVIEGVHTFLINEQTGEKKTLADDEVWKLKRFGISIDKTPLPEGWIFRIIPRHAKIYSIGNQEVTAWPLPEDHDNVTVLNDSILLIRNKHGLLQWFDYQRGKVKLNTYFPKEDNFIAYTPDNYYYASRQTASGLHLSDGLYAFGFEQFDLINNRPDLVIRSINERDSILIKLFKSAYDRRLERMDWKSNFLDQSVDVPKIELLSNHDAVVVKERDFTFSLKAASSKSPIERILVSINDVPLYGRKGAPGLAQNQKFITKEISVPLNIKENLIKITALNQAGIASRPITFSVFYDAPETPPNLYLLTIGVSDYHAEGKDLQYAAKDAKNIASMYQSAQGFGQVYTRTLTDTQVTKANIHALRQWLEGTSVDDQVLLFVSGHGLLDKNYDFYYATHDIDFANPAEKGIRYDEIEGLLDGIPARKKLMLMDACHSGEYDKDALPLTQAQQDSLQKKGVTFKGFAKGKPILGLQNSFEMMQQLFVDLRRGSGATVISSSSGVQVSYEDEEWANGAFTYAFLYGLKTMEADANRDGQVTASEIQAFVGDLVPRLTRNLQVPTFRRENLEFDFRVW